MKFNMLRDIEKVMRNERNRNVYQRDRRFCFHFKGVSYFLTGIEIAVIKKLFITEVRLYGKQHCKCIWLHKGVNRRAAQSFKNVRNSDDYGFFDGESKCTDKSVIFASVGTLGRGEYLKNKYFAPDYFNYIVIDEFHHAVNDQYQRIE